MEKVKESAHVYYLNNKDGAIAEYKEKNKKKIKEDARSYYEKNRDEIREKRRAYYQANKERLSKVARERYQKFKASK